MEAPEKLYVDTENRLSDSILYGFTERKAGDIEYIRKDAFIEKACEFFNENMWECTFQSDEVYVVDGNASSISEFIRNFKDYMEEQE